MNQTRNMQTKASRLKTLSEIVSVPKFHILNRNDCLPDKLAIDTQYLIRSSSSLEDQENFSNAGQLKTIGPVNQSEVHENVTRLFNDAQVEEIIVHEYVQAENWGVAFCLSQNSFLIEYSTQFEGVTSGRVNPFTALLPCELPRYQLLYKQLKLIFDRYGPCDVEFVNIDSPQYVQVRPITSDTVFDSAFVNLKMHLQELSSSVWIENDLCRVLAERDDKSQAIHELYVSSLKRVYKKMLKRTIDIPKPAIIKIAKQYFMDSGLEQQIKPTLFEIIRLGFQIPKLLQSFEDLDLDTLSIEALMEYNIQLSLAYEIFKIKNAMLLRERIRSILDNKLPMGSIPVMLNYHDILADTIEFDPQQCIWKKIGLRDQKGIIVVEGDFESGPYYQLTDRNQSIPKDVIVITEQLYPEIGQSIKQIKGIICQYGSLSSHIAILAREFNVPLKIQTNIHDYEPSQSKNN